MSVRNQYNFTYIMIEQPGEYIATVLFESGEESRYSVWAHESEDSFLYSAYAQEV